MGWTQVLAHASADVSGAAETGYAPLPLGLIPGLSQAIVVAQDAVEKFRGKWEAHDRHIFMMTGHHDPLKIPELRHVIFHPTLLATAIDYMGTYPILKDVSVWWSMPWDKIIGAQKLHIDSIPDTRSLRFLIFLSDVDDECGPVHALPADKTLQFIRKTGYLGGTISDQMIHDMFGTDALQKVVGPAGTGIAIDTCKCLHYGSRNMSKGRLVLSISFATYYCEERSDFTKTALDDADNDAPRRMLLRMN